ncbi:LxmA leader domain family RiPP [Jatrophihabitans sp. YIM 134969]
MSEDLMNGYAAYASPSAIVQERGPQAVEHPDTSVSLSVSLSLSVSWSWSWSW